MVEMMNFMPVYFTIVKTEGLFYSVLLAKDTLFSLTFLLTLIFLFASSFLAMVPGLRWINLV